MRRCVDVFSTYPGFSALWMPVYLGKASSSPMAKQKSADRQVGIPGENLRCAVAWLPLTSRLILVFQRDFLDSAAATNWNLLP